MSIESDDEARHAAEAIKADIASGGTRVGDDYMGLYSASDQVWIGRFLTEMLTDAIHRWRAGDHSPETTRLVEFARVVKAERDHADAERAAQKVQRDAERRAATSAAIGAAADIGHRMTGMGVRGVPLPDDAGSRADGWITTRVAEPDALMAFYIAHLSATGWTLDLDNSIPATKVLPPSGRRTEPMVMVPQCHFTHPDIAGRYITITVGPNEDSTTITRLHVIESEED